MDSEQILINMFKQQQYDVTQNKMQKMIMLLSISACSVGVVFMLIFNSGILNTCVFAGGVIFAGAAILLARFKVVSLNIASFSFLIYVCFILIPVFWYSTSITGSAPYISIIILVGALSMFSGKMLKILLYPYLILLFALTVYSAVIEIPVAVDLPSVVYIIVAYIITIVLISSYLLSKLKKLDELNDKFLRSSFKDELTRLLNRKLLDIIMQYEESLYKKEKSDYVLIMFDIDKFKKMNDEHGHVFGDVILRNFAKCISDKVRSSDFVVRYGGDEFLVVQTNATNTSISMFIDRIEEAMASSCEMEIKITASYGFAARSECKTQKEVLDLADKRLYEKKEALANKGN